MYHERGNISIGTQRAYKAFHIQRKAGGVLDNAAIRFDNFYLTEGYKVWDIENFGENLSIGFGFEGMNDNPTVNKLFTFSQRGNFGIGTETPEKTLHLKNSTNNPVLRFEGLYDGSTKDFYPLSWDIRLEETGLLFDFTMDGDYQPGIVKINSSGITASKFIGAGAWNTNGNNYYYNDGNVGIGVSNPEAKLHIQGNLICNDGNVGIGVSTPTYKLHIESNNENILFLKNTAQDQDNDRFSIKIHDNVVTFAADGTSTAPDFLFKRYNKDALRITANGIFCKKVTVNVDFGADFVFEPNYNLLPLSELEKFVTTNKHLPNIPSEKEIQKNGLNLGNTDIKLLQKIEELTLYIIDLNKRIGKLEKENKELKNK